MRKIILLFLVAFTFVNTIIAQNAGIYGSYIILGDTYYNCKSTDADKTDFHDHSFGSFSANSSFILNGGEIKTWKSGGADVTGAYLYYRIYESNSTTPPAFNEIQLEWKENGINGNSNNQRWAKTDNNINILESLTAGTYTLEVYFKATTNGADIYDSNSSENYKASFKVIRASITPNVPTRNQQTTITFDASGTDLEGEEKIYFHSGVGSDKPNSKAFSHSKGNWAQDDGLGIMTKNGNIYSITLSSIDAYYDLTNNDDAFALNFLFRSADGKKKDDNSGENYHFEIDAGNYFLIQKPEYSPLMVQENTDFTCEANASSSTNWILDEMSDETETASILQNITTASSVNFTHNVNINDQSVHYYKLTANFGANSKSKFFKVKAYSDLTPVNLPTDAKPGVNYNTDGSITFVLHTPVTTEYNNYEYSAGGCTSSSSTATSQAKNVVYLIGDFNNWEINDDYQLSPTSNKSYWHITLTQNQLINLRISGANENVYQYLVDGDIRIGDPYTHQVSDPDDKNISSNVYPNIIPYPYGKTEGQASVVKLIKPNGYNWQIDKFERTKERNALNVYELHFRDFTPEGTYKAAITKLDYLKDMGINCIHVMPVSEFEGNDSWGYNPNYYFAADKAYGPQNDLKEFIDNAHKRGIAVVNDLVLNHAFYSNPNAMLYWDKTNNRPADDNPWFNPEHKGIYEQGGHWGADWNHASNHTQKMLDNIINYWMNEFKFDGFRFDFTKGFTQHDPNSSDPWASNYDACRIEILMRMAQTVWANTSGTGKSPYVIFEHLAVDAEDKALGDAGILMWSGSKPQESYMEMAMGQHSKSFWNSVYESRNFSSANYMSYMESHDEERIAFKVKEYGKNKPTDAAKLDAYISKRCRLAAAFNLILPGPRMIWQFGELGYDYSIDYQGRTGKKPDAWSLNYDKNKERLKIQRLYSLMLKFRNKQTHMYKPNSNPDYGNMGSNNANDWLRKMSFTDTQGTPTPDDDKQIIILGNFSTETDKVCNDVNFLRKGIWYKYNGDPNTDGTIYQVSDIHSNYPVDKNELIIFSNTDMRTPNIMPDTLYIGTGFENCNYTISNNNYDITKVDYISNQMPDAGQVADNAGKNGISLYYTKINDDNISGKPSSLSGRVLIYGKNCIHWVAEDAEGNKSECNQIIYVSKTSDLLISEYVEPKSGNGSLELYNGTSSEIDLSNYKIKIGLNKETSLSGTLPISGFKVYSANDLNANFSNNQVISLYKKDSQNNFTEIDKINELENKTLRRKNSVTSPNTNYTSCEWIELSNVDKNHIDNLGYKTPLLHYSNDNETVCFGESITFTANGLGKYQFFVNGTSQQALSTNSTYTSSTLNNNDKVKVKVEGACDITSDEINVSMENELNAALSVTNNKVCDGENAIFNINGSNNATITYQINNEAIESKVLDDTGKANITFTNVIENKSITLSKITSKSSKCYKTLAITKAIEVQAKPNAGTNGTLKIDADTDLTADMLFQALKGNPDNGGNWSPAIGGAGIYTYTVAATTPCSNNATATVNVSISVSGVELSSNGIALEVGESEIITANITPANATNKELIWSSSYNNIATVDNGKITAFGFGETVITVKTQDGNYTANCNVKVTNKTIAVTEIKLNKNKLKLEKGDSESLIATIQPENATNKNITWTSSNPNLVSVDNTGLITAIEKGTSVITASTEDGNYIAECTVEVYTATGINDFDLTNVQIWTSERKIFVKDAKYGEIVKIYNTVGKLIYSHKLQNKIHSITAKVGLYIVEVGSYRKKVIVR